MPDPIGPRLNEARIARGISLEEAAQATRIRLRFIQALEEDRPEEFPSRANQRGFLRIYADFLKVSLEPPAQEIPAQTEPEIVPPVPPQETKEQKPVIPTAREIPAEPEPVPLPRPASASQQMFKEIGEKLRVQREQLGLSLNDVEKHTHLRYHYLKAIEEGNIASLPSLVQFRGMLSNYARFLNLNIDELLEQYADALQQRREELLPPPDSTSGARHKPAAPVTPNALQKIFSLDLLMGSGLIIFLVTFIIWASIQVLSAGAETSPTQAAPGLSDVLLASAEATTSQTLPAEGLTVTPNPLPAESLPLQETATVNPTVVNQAAAEGTIQVYVIATNRVWMRVTVDNKVQFEGRTTPGSAYTFGGNKSIELLTGNAGGLQVVYNQANLGTLGSWAEVVDLIFTAEGQVAPTPTVTPTVTRTPRPSATAPVSVPTSIRITATSASTQPVPVITTPTP